VVTNFSVIAIYLLVFHDYCSSSTNSSMVGDYFIKDFLSHHDEQVKI
jgi:hypothetical protein